MLFLATSRSSRSSRSSGFPGSTPPYFPCEAWNSGLHGKTSYPFLTPSLSLFLKLSPFHAPSPTFHAFTPE
jgi:hypothetical protein